MARIIGITYAGLTIGRNQSDASYKLTDRYRISSGYPEFSITFDVVVTSAVRATFLASEAALVAAFRKPDQALLVELGSTARHDLDPADNTGFNARATCAKVGGEEDTANSARYRCSVTVQLPADLTGRDGRQDSTVHVDSTPAGKRTIVVEGTYTALSASSATAQYTSSGATWADAVAATFGTFNLINPSGYAYDDQNKVLRFRRVYEEVFYREGVSATDVASLKRPSMQIDRTTPPNTSTNAFNARPLERLRAQYTTFVDSSVSTDLESVYLGTVRPLLVAELAAIGNGSVVVTSSTPSYDRTENMIRVVMEAAVDLGGTVYAGRLEVQDVIRNGKTLVPVWSGNPYSRDLYDTPASHRKIVQRFTVQRADANVAARFLIPNYPGFVEVEQYRREQGEHVGVTSDGFDVVQVTQTFVFDRADLDGPTASVSTDADDRTVIRIPLGFNS